MFAVRKKKYEIAHLRSPKCFKIAAANVAHSLLSAFSESGGRGAEEREGKRGEGRNLPACLRKNCPDGEEKEELLSLQRFPTVS